MTRTPLTLTLAAALVSGLTACASEEPSGRAAALEASRRSNAAAKAEEHPDAQFLVTYAGQPFRVHVRYVPLIDESVVAVQQGAGEAPAKGWTALDAGGAGPLPTAFADEGYEDVAIGIARAVQSGGGVCSNGQSLDMATDEKGDIRTLYRRNRQVWVVFALCPEQVAG